MVVNANSKALNAIFCGISPDKFHKISHVTIAKEAWQILETTYEIKIQELIGSLQTYELSLPSQRKSKSLALKTVNERLEAQDSSNEDEVEKDVAYLAKKFRKFLKFKRDGKSFENGKFPKFKKDKKDFKKKDSRDSSLSKMVTCFECKGHRHVKKECPTYLKAKGKVFATTLSD